MTTTRRPVKPSDRAFLLDVYSSTREQELTLVAEHEVTAASLAPCSAGCGALVAPQDRRVSSECQACADQRVLDRYADLFEDDDRPYCTPCRRHHDIGAHYAPVAS
jgi:hypothetical protein